MSRVVFRVDASVQIGTGHVYRCLVLARELRKRGVDCHFLHRLLQGNMAARIRSEGFPVTELTPPKRKTCGTNGYEAWLGVPQFEDAQETLPHLEKLAPDWVILDHYSIGAEWEQIVKQCTRWLGVIDDLANRSHDCDLLVDQNYFRELARRYRNLVPSHCQTLLGPFYALINPAYGKTRRTRKDIARIFIFYGGVDATSEITRALRILSKESFRHIPVDIVAGIHQQTPRSLEVLVSAHPNARLLPVQKDLLELMTQADLALGAGGVTMWERCANGLPTIVTTVAENQIPSTRELARYGSIVYAGHAPNISDQDFENVLKSLFSSPSQVMELSNMAQLVTDGLGVMRVAEAMFASHYKDLQCRSANAEDVLLYFLWANDPEVRRNAFSSAEIKWSTHKEWFSNRLRDPETRLLVFETHHGVPVGQIRLENRDGETHLDYSIARTFRGRGWSAHLLTEATQIWLEELTTKTLIGEVKTGNVKSVAAFKKAGFEQVRSGHLDTLRFEKRRKEPSTQKQGQQ